MRFMVLVKANADAEAGVMPDGALMAAMGAYNEELVKAGVLRGGEGLHPTSRAARVRFTGDTSEVIHGPFTLSADLVSGFWLWEVASQDEAIAWLRRAPFKTGEVEIRRLFEPADFAASDPTGEHREKEAALRARVEAPHGG